MTKIKKPNGILVTVLCTVLLLIVYHWQTSDADDYSGIFTVPLFFILSPITAVLLYRYIIGRKK